MGCSRMSGRNISVRTQAEHYRHLAEWTSDARTHDILMEMARELETGGEADEAAAEAPAPAVPRSLS